MIYAKFAVKNYDKALHLLGLMPNLIYYYSINPSIDTIAELIKLKIFPF